jgi:N-acetylmuramoyl-L-alanine amidase
VDRVLLRAFVLACCIASALAPRGQAAAAQRVVAVRHWTAPDHTRVVVDLTEAADYSTRVLTEPDRIVVFVLSARLDDSADPVTVGDGLVERVRLNQLDRGAQIVVDLSRASAHNVFDLKPYAGKPHRVVIDVFREGSATATNAPAQTPTAPRATPAAAAPERAVRTVVIDAGHGGEDPGATGSGNLVEKDIVLDIAKRLATALDARSGIDVRMTRLGDYGVSLGRRRQIARQGACDLFVSVHANSAPNRDANGTEVFFLSPRGASDQKARELENRENAADLVGGVSPDADEDVLSILVDLKTADSMEKSADLAELVSSELDRCGVAECSVKQAGFVVLKSLEMPSVLIEVGFLTNKADRKRLASGEYRGEYADCLAGAIAAYFERYEPVAGTGGSHRVSPGETLWSIARRYGMTVDELRRVNRLGDDATIKVGQDLVVRGG